MESVALALPAIVFIVFFLVYRDQGFLKPYLDQQKKQKTIKGAATVCAQDISYDPMNQRSKPIKDQDQHIYTGMPNQTGSLT